MVRRIAIAALVLIAALAAAVYWRVRPVQQVVFSDADRIRVPQGDAAPRDILWQPPARLAEIAATGREDYEPRLSWDGLTLYFVRGKAGENADIFVSTRTPAGWTPPQPLAELNSEYDDLGPAPSGDGTTIYFYSNRPGGSGGYDLWLARRGDAGWLPPSNLGPTVNSPFNDYGPALAPDGRVLYFASNRPRPVGDRGPDPDAWVATVREDLYQHDYDLYAATVGGSGFGVAVSLNALNSGANEGAPAVSPVGDFVYFSSDRPGGSGGFDLYRARRLGDEFRPVERLPAPVNTAANELDPGLAMGGYALYFSSDRNDLAASAAASAPAAVADASKPARPDYDLYYSMSREVFLDTESLQRPPIDWAALWAEIGPGLMWSLLALLAILALLAFLRDMRGRTMSLLTRCLLLSLLAHLVLMLLSGFWQVSTGLAAAISREGRISVALASPVSLADITQQVRGRLSEIEPPAPRETLVERAAPRIESADAPREVQLAIAPQRPVEAALPREVAPRESTPPPEESPVKLPVPPTLEADAESIAIPVLDAAERQSTPEQSAATPRDTASIAVERPRIAVAASQPVTAEPARVELPRMERAAGDDQPLVDPIRSAQASNPSLASAAPQVALLNAARDIPMAPTAAPAAPSDVAPATAVAEDDALAPPPPVQEQAAPRAATDRRLAQVQFATETRMATVDVPSAPRRDDSALLGPRTIDQVTAARPVPATVTDASRTLLDGLAAPAEQDYRTPDSASPPPAATDEPALAVAVAPEWTATATTPRAAAPALPVAGSLGAAQPMDVPLAPIPAQDEPLVSTTAARTTELSRGVSAATGAAPSLPGLLEIATPELSLALPTESEPEPVGVLTGDGPDAADAVHVVRGRAIDESTGKPISGVRVQLDLPQGGSAAMRTDAEGRFELPAGELPEHFAVAASKDGYEPASVNVDRARLAAPELASGRSMAAGDPSASRLIPASADAELGLPPAAPSGVEIRLRRARSEVVALERRPTVHHLGNDRFEGQINSQFQRESEGLTREFQFELTVEQLRPNLKRAELRLLAKGVQCPHPVFVNGEMLSRGLKDAPPDGSFGDQRLKFPASLLQLGVNTIEIEAIDCGVGDIDDFEYVNLRIRLRP